MLPTGLDHTKINSPLELPSPENPLPAGVLSAVLGDLIFCAPFSILRL